MEPEFEEKHVYAAMCYIFVLVLVPVLTRKEDPFINFHARQGLIMMIGIVISAIVANWISWLGSLMFLLLLIVDVIALVQAMQGNSWKIPFVGNLAEKIRI